MPCAAHTGGGYVGGRGAGSSRAAAAYNDYGAAADYDAPAPVPSGRMYGMSGRGGAGYAARGGYGLRDAGAGYGVGRESYAGGGGGFREAAGGPRGYGGGGPYVSRGYGAGPARMGRGRYTPY